MTPGRMPANARAILRLPYPANAPVAPQPQALNSHSLHTQTSPARLPPIQPVVLRYEKHQDDMPVKSTEGQEQGVTGMRHYAFMHKLNQLDSQPSRDHIDYRQVDAHVTDSDAPLEADVHPVAFSDPPTPPPSTGAYGHPIYMGSTHSPSVFLAILRIAQHNLPSVEFASAINHIPNMRPTDQLPLLYPAAPGDFAPVPFLDELRPARRIGDDNISVAFLPHFYDGGERHGIAFFEYVADLKRGRVLGSACVTPCSEEDLFRYGLVKYINSNELVQLFGQQVDEDVDGVDVMDKVGVEGGKWLERETVEDWDEWSTAFRTCAVAWEMRVRLMRGEYEG